jgi:nucleoid-associated protein YgaU
MDADDPGRRRGRPDRDTYVPKAGVSGIAERFYGDASQWKRIYEANKKVIGPDPDKLGVDVTLTIPYPVETAGLKSGAGVASLNGVGPCKEP